MKIEIDVEYLVDNSLNNRYHIDINVECGDGNENK